MNKPNGSISIPVYNVSHYLQKCLKSVVNQTLNNIEIIVVNDCSPDPLDENICTDFASKDERITYIRHKKNLGLGGARNTGLNIATGDYIWFIDSDDFIDINACKFLYNLTKTTNIDVIAFSATSHVNGNLNLSGKEYYYYKRECATLDQIFTGKEFIDTASVYNSFHVSACLHLFKRQLISNYRFRENVIHEDTDLIPIVIYNASSIYCIKYAPYYRLLREGSVTQSEINERTLVNKISSVESLLNYAKKYKLHDPDPLLSFIHKEFNYIDNLYFEFGKKTKLTEDLFSSLRIQYKNSIQGKPSSFDKDNHEDFKKKYLHLKQELDTIKNSHFWKITEYLRSIKYFFKA